ncbi:MAG: acetate kinase [Firmicutes bacterium]|nr:acetate kinase [Bacillota bacterium]
MKILVLNSGSSSLKYKLFEVEKDSLLAWGLVERIGIQGTTSARLRHETKEGRTYQEEHEIPDHGLALQLVLQALVHPEHGVLSSLAEIAGVGHRVLHGGEIFTEAVKIDHEVLPRLKELIPLGPLHMPANIMGIEACRRIMPGVPQVAVFDTSFHQTMPRAAYLYAIPTEYYRSFKIRKYGFHGTSHRYVSARAAEILGVPLATLRMITLHLGNGSSAAAIKDGRCLDTTMGFTPLEGLVMGTRSGDIAPAAVAFLAKALKLDWDGFVDLLNKKSGFLGLSGLSADMRDIQKARAEGHQGAIDAYEVFRHRLIKHIGAFVAVLGGLDVLVFTGGIGENDGIVREDVCRALAYLGLTYDPELTLTIRGREAVISREDSRVKVLVVPTNEELLIARDTYRLIS